jgi:hypothetical protein
LPIEERHAQFRLHQLQRDGTADNTSAYNNHIIGTHDADLSRICSPGCEAASQPSGGARQLKRSVELDRQDLRFVGQILRSNPVLGGNGFMCLREEALNLVDEILLPGLQLLAGDIPQISLGRAHIVIGAPGGVGLLAR